MEEIHHTQKLDAPSGTAITLAEGIIDNSTYTSWKLDNALGTEIPITSRRIGKTPGTHIINYSSDVDTIEIKHTAHNRQGFALGAVIAAEWIVGKTGVFTMKDVLNLG
jgi:4-hydroxy-tetrahydrodipicolinate reductase